MNPLWLIVGALIGCALVHLTEIILTTEWRPRRCQRGKPCGCRKLDYSYGKYRMCEDAAPKKDKNP